MAGVEGSAKRLNGTMGSAALQTGRLGNQFAGLAGQLTGIHPIIGNVAGVLGNFAVGAGLTVGVLGGLAAIALAYDTLTKSARAAAKAQDEAVSSLLKSRHLKIVGGATGQDVLLARSKLNALLAEGTRLQKELDANRGIPGLEGLTLEKIQANQDAIHAVQQAIDSGKDSMEKVAPAIKNATSAIKGFAVAAQQAAINWREFVETYGEKHGPSLDQITNAWAQETMLGGVKGFATSGQFGGDFSMPNIGLNDGLTKEQIRTRDALIGNADQNTQTTTEAIWGAAIQSASIIAGALNVGGGGRGSGIGGALGGALGGAALGGKLGAFGGPIGSVVGAIAGSFIGGLFDHKKAVETNTNAVRQNTAALLLNSPTGYKTASGRFSATDVKELKRVIPSYNSRGGAVASI